ncbi:sporulation protein [Streptomyces sp. TRM43335]|uniref:Sporulation protein n=1 Tax=Streptomyces taklimakanensis TaxID=2569853 RepID=A0A6G2BH80_9ACTN|nr:sporulation protein [Streptomyces taklimakanensis]MTE21429.1 sporulation protein [Streptomyces taklimakanensis]
MVFKRLLGSLGVGGPTVDTVLEEGAVLPGGTLSGRVHLRGGSADFDIEHIGLELVARVEAETDGGEHEGTVAFGRFTVGGGFRLAEGAEHNVPFTVTLPWETPVTELHGQPLGVALGVRTELAVAGAKDKGDLDPLAVRALPAQEAILEAFGQLGFGFKSADLEYGHIRGTGQQLPFYQEIELTPSPRYAHAVNEIEVTFLANPAGVEVVLEADKRGGSFPGFSGGHDALTRFTVGHQDVRDWNAEVDDWVRRLVEGRVAHGAPYGPGHDGLHGHDGIHGHHGHHGHDGHDGHRSGPGMGTAIAAGAAGLAVGVAGGMVAAEVVDEVGDFFEGEDDGGDEG